MGTYRTRPIGPDQNIQNWTDQDRSEQTERSTYPTERDRTQTGDRGLGQTGGQGRNRRTGEEQEEEQEEDRRRNRATAPAGGCCWGVVNTICVFTARSVS